MKNLSQNKARILIVIGLCALASVGLTMHYQLDFVAGLGLGTGATTVLIGLRTLSLE